MMAASATLLALAAGVLLPGASGEGIWVGTSAFGADPIHVGPNELPPTTNRGHTANIRAEASAIQKDRHANPVMASPDVRFGVVGSGQQMISVAEGDSLVHDGAQPPTRHHALEWRHRLSEGRGAGMADEQPERTRRNPWALVSI